MKKKAKLLLNLALTLFFAFFIFLRSPNLNPLYSDGAFAILFIISAFLIVNFLFGLGGLKVYADEFGRMKFDIDKSVKGTGRAIGVLAIIWGVYFIVNIASSPIVNYWAYRDQLGTPTKAEFTEEIQPVDLSQIPIVDQYLAYTLADKKLGENPGMGSQVVLGVPVIQTVNDKLMWVVPLEHSGFFKWLQNIDGTAGYITVSATDTSDVEFVGDHKLKYGNNAYLFDNLNRKARFSGNVFTGLTDYSFEIDDAGVPHWIITTYENEWLFALPEATGVVVINATTGETNQYTLETVPEWVDRVQPESFVINQINNQGQYVHGIFNFSNRDKFMTSQDHIIVYNEGKPYLFTGLTSVGADESAIGFIMVDLKTKEAITYQMSGATEYAAQRSAEGKVQQFGYIASFPIIINLDGMPTYVMTLKDDFGLIKQYAFVSVSDFSFVGVGETLEDARRNYRNVVGGTAGSGSLVEGELENITGNIIRISEEIQDGTTLYKFIIDSAPDMIFTASFDVNNVLALTQEQDSVTISYAKTSDSSASVAAFANDTLGF